MNERRLREALKAVMLWWGNTGIEAEDYDAMPEDLYIKAWQAIQQSEKQS